MARREVPEARAAYLVEHYRPGLDVEELARCVARVRDTVAELARDGEAVRFLRSTIVPRDESFLCILEAASEVLVREAYVRAGIPFERISAAITEATTCDQGGRP